MGRNDQDDKWVIIVGFEWSKVELFEYNDWFDYDG